jgi:hypothetical protein
MNREVSRMPGIATAKSSVGLGLLFAALTGAENEISKTA